MKDELIYHLHDRPPFGKTLLAALVHLLAMFVAVIMPSLLIGKGIGLADSDTTRLVSMSLFASGIAGFIQMSAVRIGKLQIGSGLLSIQGTSFNFVAAIIAGASLLKDRSYDDSTILAAIFGTLFLASFTQVILSAILRPLRKIISNLVCGIVVMIIGLTLIHQGLISAAGGYASMDLSLAENLQFASLQNLLLSAIVLIFIIIFNSLQFNILRLGSLFFAIIIGACIAAFLGRFDLASVQVNSAFMLPEPLFYGLSIEPGLLLPFMIIFIITSLETMGDISATSELSGEPTKGELYETRLKAAVFANGLNSAVSALFNTFPNSCFGQNNAVIALSGVASRYVGFFVCGGLIICSFFPIIASLALAIPEPVIGGAILVMFGTIASTGIKIIAKEPLDKRAVMILAISLAFGLGISSEPRVLEHLPSLVQNLFGSAIACAGISAILLELLLPKSSYQSNINR